MIRAIAVLLLCAGCAGESTECIPENHCFLDPGGNATCEVGHTWVDPYTPGDYRCAPISSPVCEPLTCAQAVAECGMPDDGCGGVLDCGVCPDTFLCGLDFQCHRQECQPESCGEQGLECGAGDDGCGEALDCGTCPSGFDCESNICRPGGCTPHADSVCVEGELVWRDSCGQLEEVRDDCGGWGCDGSVCLTWRDHWSCASDYYDAGDGCDCACGIPDPDCELAGQTLYNCEPGEVCSAEGECVAAPCDHLCAAGATSCQSGTLRSCTTDPNGCRVWGPGQSCPTTCADAISCSTCSHECQSLGAQACADGAVTTCVTGSDGCYDWSTPVACGSGFCADTDSCGSCTNLCSAGQTRCQGGVLESCTADANGCLDFGAPVSCSDGFCADASTCGVCDHECTTAGAVRCQGGDLSTCVADGNGCRSWQYSSTCTSGTCADGVSCLTCETTCAAPTRCIGSTLTSCGLNDNGCRNTSTTSCLLGCGGDDECNRCTDHRAPVLGRSNIGDSLDANVWDFVLNGDVAYAAQGEDGLAILDVANWDAMVTLGRLVLDGDVTTLAVSGNTVFAIQRYPNALVAIDVSSDATPVELGRMTLHDPGAVVMSGSLALVADGSGPDGGLKIIDVSDPTSPTLTGHRITSGDAGRLATVGTHAYVACGDGGLEVIDISNPSQPSWAFNLPGADTAAVVTGGGLAYLATANAVRVLDTSDPAAPVQLVGQSLTLGWASLDLAGDVLYATDSQRSYRIDVSDPMSPTVTGSLRAAPMQGSAYALEPVGNHVMLSFSSHELVVYPTDWTNGTSVYVSGDTILQAREGNIQVLGDDETLTLYDISNRRSPMALGTISTGWSKDMTAIDIQGHLLFVGADNYQSYDPDTTYVDIYDISNASAPLLLHSVYLGAHNAVSSVMARGELLYVTEQYGGFIVIDISTPADAVIVGSLEYHNGPMVHDDEYAYVADSSSLEVIELLHPSHPLLAGQEYFGESINAIAWEDDRLVVAGNDKRLAVYDTSAAPALTLVWETTLTERPYHLALANGQILVGAYSESFLIEMADPARYEHLTTLVSRLRGVDLVDNQMQVFFQNGYVVREVCAP